ncbi:MAG TPA: preprotein translocase subunit SecG [Stellaceae bacterium]|nr:preprotein translocase subunit SecG [Stellaceae bacterium]
MIVLLFIIHVGIAVALVGVILLQKSEGGALGMGGGGMSGFMTGRTTANLLTRTTAILAIAFFTTSVLLVVLSQRSGESRSLLDRPPVSTQEVPSVPTAPAAPTPAAPAPTGPAVPATPPGASAPLAK